MRKMKDSNIQWIGQIPNSWEIRKVKQCFYISKEQAHDDNPTVLSLARSNVKVRDISTNEGQMAASYENYNPVQPGDLLLNPMDLYSGANCNVSEISGVISPAYVNLRKKTQLNPNFFDYYFKVQYWAMAMFAHGKGVSFDNRWTMNADAILNYYLPYPSYDAQNKIVKHINQKCAEIDRLIEIENEQIEKLKEYKQAVITEAVTKGLDKSAPLKDSGVEWIGEIPQDWRVLPLKSLFSFGKGLPITKENLIEEGIPVISYGQIHAKWNSGVTLHNELKRYVSDAYLETNPECLVNEGDFIFADTSEDREGCGNAAFVDSQELIFAGYHTIVLRANNSTYSKYLAYLFLTDNWRQQIRTRVSGVKLFSISKKILCDTSVLLPSDFDKIIDYLNKKCTGIDSLIEIKKKKIDELNEYKKSLIYEYVTGKKEVV